MTWTWTEVIALALVRSGVVGLGQVATASQSSVGMNALNLLLDRWDGQGLALPDFYTSITFNTVANQAQYLLGDGASEAYAVRPETIVGGKVTIGSNPATYMDMVELSFQDYFAIPVPAITAQPWNYAINPTWPQMELYLYPTPDTIYPVTFNCKVKWISTVGQPELNPFDVAEVPSGYADALVANLALEIAQMYRLDTATLENKASSARFTIAAAVAAQHRDAAAQVPVGLWAINVLQAGRNP
jgi:hypothetical protein